MYHTNSAALDRLVTGLMLLALAVVMLINPLHRSDTGARAPGVDPRAAHANEAASHWIAPQTDQAALAEISPFRWRMDFAPVEQYLRGIEFDDAEGLRLTGAHLPGLTDLVLALQMHDDEVDQARLGHLIRRTFPGEYGQHLEQVFLGLYRYSLAQPGEPEPIASLDALDAQRRLQQQYLGPDYAEALWGEQNRLRQRLLLRREGLSHD
jgi:hypothetical protein